MLGASIGVRFGNIISKEEEARPRVAPDGFDVGEYAQQSEKDQITPGRGHEPEEPAHIKAAQFDFFFAQKIGCNQVAAQNEEYLDAMLPQVEPLRAPDRVAQIARLKMT